MHLWLKMPVTERVGKRRVKPDAEALMEKPGWAETAARAG